MAARDITKHVGPERAGLSPVEEAELDAIAPERLAYIESSGIVSDVRSLPDGSGWAKGSHKDFLEYGFVTVLEDGFVVSTGGLVGRGNFYSALGLLTLQAIDPGVVMKRAASARELYKLHRERCGHFSGERKSPAREEQDRHLYFDYRAADSAQLGRLVAHQMTPVLPMMLLGLVIGPGILGRFVVAAAMAVAAFIGGTLLYKFRRGTTPMLPPLLPPEKI